jgi:hypothetical protein
MLVVGLVLGLWPYTYVIADSDNDVMCGAAWFPESADRRYCADRSGQAVAALIAAAIGAVSLTIGVRRLDRAYR